MIAPLSMRAALNTATDAISSPIGACRTWRFTAPPSAYLLDGRVVTVRAESYAQARRRRTEMVVQIALNLMGVPGTVVKLDGHSGTARQLLKIVLADRDEHIDPPGQNK